MLEGTKNHEVELTRLIKNRINKIKTLIKTKLDWHLPYQLRYEY